MSGKEYKARSRTVQKMSREGLVEENLRTGESKRAVTGREGELRLGDRPMESLMEDGSAPAGKETGWNLRLGMHGAAAADEGPQEGHGGLRMDFRGAGEHPGEGKRKNAGRMSGRRESSSREAPFSLEGSKDASGSPYTGAHQGRESLHSGEAGTGGQEGFRAGEEGSARQEGFRAEDAGYAGRLRAAGAADPASGEDLKQDARRRLRQRETAKYQENEKRRESAKYLENTESASDVHTESGPSGLSPGSAYGFRTGEMFSAKTDLMYEYRQDPIGEEDEASNPAQSRRPQGIRGHPAAAASASPAASAGQAARTAGALRHDDGNNGWKGSYGKGEKPVRNRLRETSSDLDGLDSFKEEIRTKQKKERLNQEQRKAGKASRLSFDGENGMIAGSGTGFGRRKPSAAASMAAGSARAAAGAVGYAAHAKVSETEDENSGIKAAHHAEMVAEDSLRASARRAGSVHISSGKPRADRRMRDKGGSSVRLQFDAEESAHPVHEAKTEKEKKAAIRKFFRKQRQRRIYAAAKKEEKTVEAAFRAQQSFVSKAASVVKEAILRNSRTFLVLGAFGIVFLLVCASVGSCAALLQGAGSSVVSTTYPSTDEDIYAVENRYRELEAGLNDQINRMRQEHPAYDEFRYQIDEISHNPYHLISYFTTKYGQFTYEQVKDELEEIFREQYQLVTDGETDITITETRTIQPGESLGQVVTSGYCSCEICCGPYAGGTTASGVYPVSDHTIAVDAYDPFVPMGTHVVMNGIEYVVEDTGAFARFGVQFDVYYDDHQTALSHGHRTWDAYLASDNPEGALEVTTTRTVSRLSVVLTNHDLDAVLESRLTDEEKVRYTLYNYTYGNRDYLFDLNALPAYGRASSDYTVPPEALSDERFARMIREAERYLGVPYVWGGYSPSGFDCSGFVSWVINHCGNGWDYGRRTAEGLRQICYYVSPEDAKPGDLVFFERTYDTAGASHVGIYAGDGMMIHAGEPVQYTSLRSEYWQSHLMQYGRLP